MRAARPRNFDQVVELVAIALELFSPLEFINLFLVASIAVLKGIEGFQEYGQEASPPPQPPKIESSSFPGPVAVFSFTPQRPDSVNQSEIDMLAEKVALEKPAAILLRASVDGLLVRKGAGNPPTNAGVAQNRLKAVQDALRRRGVQVPIFAKFLDARTNQADDQQRTVESTSCHRTPQSVSISRMTWPQLCENLTGRGDRASATVCCAPRSTAC